VAYSGKDVTVSATKTPKVIPAYLTVHQGRLLFFSQDNEVLLILGAKDTTLCAWNSTDSRLKCRPFWIRHHHNL